MRLALAWNPLVLLALCNTPLLAAEADESLVERLEAAGTAREQHDILDVIAERATEQPFSIDLTDRLIAELMSEETYGYHYIMRALPQLAGEDGFSEQSLLKLAEALSGNMTRQYDSARAIAEALSAPHERNGLSNQAFSELVEALEHPSMLNRSAAIKVLAVTRPEDSRYATAMESILRVLNNHDHNDTRNSAITGLARLTRDQAMPPNVLAGLVRSATTDPYMTVRMDALELLAARDIDAQTRTLLSTSLAEEISSPTPETWTLSGGIRARNELGDRATSVLENLHEPPYPDHVIDAWIAQTTGQLPKKSLAALKRVYMRGNLTNSQTSTLMKIADAHRESIDREMIYAMLFVELQAGALMDRLIGFENADDEAIRVRAGYTLKEQYRGKEVPDRVADVAARVALSGSNAELRAIAAGLVSNARRDGGQRESQLIAALERHPDDYDIHTAMIDLYGPDRIDELVINYATNTGISVSFRRHIIRELGKQTITESGLSRGAENTLKDVARNAGDYYLVQYAGDTLKAWGISPPLRVALKNRKNQSIALFVILIGLVIVNFMAAIVALIYVFKFPLSTKDKRKRNVVRSAMVCGWLVLTAGMLAMLAAGGVGFLGHNSAPKPSGTLLWNIPAYVSTVIYVLLTWLLWRQARKVPV